MATTWAESPYRATATCTTGTEAAPSGDVGLDLNIGVAGFAVHVETAVAVTAGTLQAYLQSPSGAWNRCPDLDISIPAGITGYASAGFSISSATGRIAFLPSGLGQASTIYIVGGGPVR